MKNGLYLIGGGGHCRACIDVVEAEGRFHILGIVELPKNINETNLGISVVGTDQDLKRLAEEDCGFLVTIGQVGVATRRLEAFSGLKNLGVFLPRIISPRAYVSSHSLIGEGTIVMHGATVNAGAFIGANCILNTHCLVEHDAHVADHCHLSTGAVINGGCRIGTGSFIGSNSVLLHGVSIAADVVIGAGSVVLRDITQAGVYVGSPCRRIR